MRDAVIVSIVRTAIGKAINGSSEEHQAGAHCCGGGEGGCQEGQRAEGRRR